MTDQNGFGYPVEQAPLPHLGKGPGIGAAEAGEKSKVQSRKTKIVRDGFGYPVEQAPLPHLGKGPGIGAAEAGEKSKVKSQKSKVKRDLTIYSGNRHVGIAQTILRML
jgi:hypothetical protein